MQPLLSSHDVRYWYWYSVSVLELAKSIGIVGICQFWYRSNSSSRITQNNVGYFCEIFGRGK